MFSLTRIYLIVDQPAMTMSLVFSPLRFRAPTSTATYSLLSRWAATSHPPIGITPNASPRTFGIRRWSHARCSVVADQKDQALLLGDEDGKSDVAEYDWRKEWYPLYLTKDVPDDAPVGLTVYDQQLVLYRDGAGELRCHQDRCPHRLAKLSEGQLIDGRLECLYHGWQFNGDGKCVKIPQLPSEAKIPKLACLKPYEVRDSQGVVWVWMSRETSPDAEKLPWFENFARPGFQETSTIHEVPYDHSILLENLMDPAHVPISHDRTDFYSKREDAQALLFHVSERSGRGFAGRWGNASDKATEDDLLPNFLRFSAPCSMQNNRETVDKKTGERHYFTGLFLCRPIGQGKSMLILRFGGTKSSPLVNLFPKWFFHQNACKVLEQDMGFLSSQNEILIRENSPTGSLYISLASSDTWVLEYRKWVDKVGHGMPHHFGHRTASPPPTPAVVANAPAGLPASVAAGFPAKGGVGTAVAGNPMNRYFRHVVHCRECAEVVKSFRAWKRRFSAVAAVLAAAAVLVAGRQWKALLLVAAAACCGGAYGCNFAVDLNTVNFIRPHRRL